MNYKQISCETVFNFYISYSLHFQVRFSSQDTSFGLQILKTSLSWLLPLTEPEFLNKIPEVINNLGEKLQVPTMPSEPMKYFPAYWTDDILGYPELLKVALSEATSWSPWRSREKFRPESLTALQASLGITNGWLWQEAESNVHCPLCP